MNNAAHAHDLGPKGYIMHFLVQKCVLVQVSCNKLEVPDNQIAS